MPSEHDIDVAKNTPGVVSLLPWFKGAKKTLGIGIPWPGLRQRS